VAEELYSGTDDAWVDEEELENIQARLDKFYRSKKKYICDFAELITLRDEAEQKLSEIESGSEMIKKLKAERQALLVEVSEKAKKLSARREEAGKLFSERVSAELEFLNMPNVSVIVDVKKGKLTADGMDNIEILISANPGEELKSISKIASGGELSRIMLAIKSVIADRDSIPTLIFDEIDSGVSGKAAQKIGFKLRELRSAHQIICVTHLSQLAVMADRHFLIEKSTDGNSTRTTINPLSTDERIMEIARIMGGADPGEAIIKGAKEELEKAQAM
jgi:DNA repair protein RecN (Recombination protein N)